MFTVGENEFIPPPKVKSAVIRLIRKPAKPEPINDALLFKLVKTGFNQRRKTLRNALKSLDLQPEKVDETFLQKRAEQVSVEEWIALTQELNQ